MANLIISLYIFMIGMVNDGMNGNCEAFAPFAEENGLTLYEDCSVGR